VPLLPLGSYRIVVEAPNLNSSCARNHAVADRTVTVGIALEVGSISEQVVVLRMQGPHKQNAV